MEAIHYLGIASLILGGWLFMNKNVNANYKKMSTAKIINIIEKFNNVSYKDTLAVKLNYYCKKYDINPEIILAIIQVESNFEKEAEGTIGERGLMQVSEVAFKQAYKLYQDEFHYNNYDYMDQVGYNLKTGILYFKYILKDKADNNIKKALAQYNGGNNPPAQAYKYADKVLKTIKHIRSI